jgi:RNA polymerase sigma factor FliA
MDSQAGLSNHGPVCAEEEDIADNCVAPEEWVLCHMPLVRALASQLIRRLPPSVEIDDLIQSGMIGLMEAARRFKGIRDSAFATFATYRIRGAMLDSLRRSQRMPRSTARRVRDIESVQARLDCLSGRESRAFRTAKALGISVDVYHRTVWHVEQSKQVSLDEGGINDSECAFQEPVDCAPGPVEQTEHEDLMRALDRAIDSLSESDRTMLLLYYDKELTLREIGVRMDLSESRICQIQRRIIGRLRASIFSDARCPTDG